SRPPRSGSSRSSVTMSGDSSWTSRIASYPVAACPATRNSPDSSSRSVTSSRMSALSSTTSTRGPVRSPTRRRSEYDIIPADGPDQQTPVRQTEIDRPTETTPHILRPQRDPCPLQRLLHRRDVSGAEGRVPRRRQVLEHRRAARDPGEDPRTVRTLRDHHREQRIHRG